MSEAQYIQKYGVSPYVVLGVNKNTDIKIIYKEFKKKSLLYHPDKNVNKKDTSKKFIAIVSAFKLIKKIEDEKEIARTSPGIDNNSDVMRDIRERPANVDITDNDLYKTYYELQEEKLDRSIDKTPISGGYSYDSSLPSGTKLERLSMDDLNKFFDFYEKKNCKDLVRIEDLKGYSFSSSGNKLGKVYAWGGILLTESTEDFDRRKQKGKKKVEYDYERDKNEINNFVLDKSIDSKKVVVDQYNPDDVRITPISELPDIEAINKRKRVEKIMADREKILNDRRNANNYLLTNRSPWN